MASTNPDTLTVCRASAGTGKTYTLAANYVGLLFSNVSYRSILAVTFTNKATQEMKDRILLFLDNIADNTGSAADDALTAAKARMIANFNATDEELRKLARKCYNSMLEDYDNIHISTIDTFLMQLLNGLGHMLDDASAGATVELDQKQLAAEAVDRLLTRPANENDSLTKHLTDYVAEKLEAGQSWNIRDSLIKIADRMYSEAVQQMDAEGKIIFDADAIINYKKAIDWKNAECLEQLKQQYAKVQHLHFGVGLTALDDFIEEVPSYLDGSCKKELMFRGAGKRATDKIYNNPQYKDLADLNDLCAACRRVYNTCECTKALLNNLALMSALRSEMQALLVERNSVLLAQTADKLHRAMAVGDADFILEKAGIRYHHIMLDEFQDTSVLQWENFKPLIEEILANGGTVFIVGDIKQSIYRWRNGNWEIMASLNETAPLIGPYFHEMPLRRNFRSSAEVVRFNLDLFKRLTTESHNFEFAADYYDEQFDGTNLADYHTPSHTGGFVRMMLVPCGFHKPIKNRDAARERIISDMFDQIEARLNAGDAPSDMLILVRYNSDTEPIVAAFRERALSSPVLAQTQLVSCDSFNLDSSQSVMFVIHVLRWLVLQDEVSKAYLGLVYPHFDIATLETVDTKIPMSELIEELVKLIPSQAVTDLAYINAFLDEVHNYIARYGSYIPDFLTFWNDKMHSVSIAAPTAEAIRIMTIHSAKGLEAKNVFIPFCSWLLERDKDDNYLWCTARAMLTHEVEPLKYIPVSPSSKLADSDYEPEYRAEHLAQRFDNLNTLYVAFTRARENLFIYGEIAENKDKSIPDTTSSLLSRVFDGNWTDQNDTLLLSFGQQQCPNDQMVHKWYMVNEQMVHRFAFSKSPLVPAELHIGERPVSFRMSREAMDSLQFTPEAAERSAMIDLGNVCHAIMEHIETQADTEAAIADARMSGLIESDEREAEVRRLINAAWTNIQLCDWFSGKWELLREATFLTANGELRPDRVMIDRSTSTAIVLDYKFGQREKQYAYQVREYMRIMTELKFTHVEGYLWYAQEAQLQPVKL